MQSFAQQGYWGQDLCELNCCRMFLQVIWLSEICDGLVPKFWQIVGQVVIRWIHLIAGLQQLSVLQNGDSGNRLFRPALD